MKEGGTIILAVVLLLPPVHVLETRCFEAKVLYLGLQTRNQWLSSFTTLFQNSSTQILACVQDILRRIISWTWVTLAYNAGLLKAVSIKWGNSNIARTVWRLFSYLKKFATDFWNVSFEQCRVVLVVCHFSDHKCRHGNVIKDIISHDYNQ